MEELWFVLTFQKNDIRKVGFLVETIMNSGIKY